MNVPNIGANFEINGYEAVQCTGNPAKDAQNFADANNLSLEDAKKVLSGQFGAPTVDDESELADNADFKPTGDPQEDLKNYANTKGLTQDEAKSELEKLFGTPNTRNVTNNTANTTTTATTTTEEKTISDADKSAISEALANLKTAYTNCEQANTLWKNSGCGRNTEASYCFAANGALADALARVASKISGADISSLGDDTVNSINSAIDNAKTYVGYANNSFKVYETYGGNSNFWAYCAAAANMQTVAYTLGTTLINAGF